MIRIMLAEDMHMVRGALVALLEGEPGLSVVAEVDRGDAIVSTALESRPDVAVIDIDLPGIDGITAAGALHQRLPECRTLVLTALGRPGTLQRALAARVSGFLLKDAQPHELAEAIRKIAQGGRVIAPELALACWESDVSPLTLRETDVLRQTASGAEPAEIAHRMNLSVGTVRNYLTAAVAKLHARNRLDAIRIAERAGWL
ncbi:response regulator [Streptomyces sp. PT12]|uniref:response regulator transcription factor n=1 Tax=Streptomyces sp. PT12 TaxID=1510197 RepID=UPI000DE32AFE|nr:response regulator transcription factor [Streptomyces sp. PT12]RBM14145.1 DNA-binding response regulator [Streptomyces sp. PT12]